MNKLALAPIGILITLSVAACSLVVNADRSKVDDNLYRPAPIDSMPTPDAGEDAATPEAGVAGAAGAAGAAGEAGAAGAPGASAAGAGGV